MSDIPSHPLLFPSHSPPTSLLLAQDHFHSAPAPHHQQTNQSHQITHHHTDSNQSTPFAMVSENIGSPQKRTRLDSSQDACNQWSSSIKKIKPVGIALPLISQKVETHESEMDPMLKVEELTEAKSSNTSVDEEVRREKGKDKMEILPSSVDCGEGNEVTVDSVKGKMKLGAGAGEVLKRGGGRGVVQDGNISNAQVSSRGNIKASVALPSGKDCHVFISHSTSDRNWAEEIMVARLSAKWRVKASYHGFDSDHDRYDNVRILQVMDRSCVVIIGISPSYVRSQRCEKEWKHAVHLFRHYPPDFLFVAGVVAEKRPVPLKDFIHLDFTNNDSKRMDHVWNVLDDSINKAMKKQLGQINCAEGRHHQHDHYRHRQPRNSDCPSHDDNQPSIITGPFREAEGTGMVNAMAEFENMWTAVGEGDGVMTEEEGRISEVDHFVADDVVDKIRGGEGAEDFGNDGQKRDDHQLDNFNTPWSVVPPCREPCDNLWQGEETEERQEEDECVEKDVVRQGMEAKMQVSRENIGDVEEGEVSDSSKENSNERCEEEQRSVPPEEKTQSGVVASFYDNLARPDADKRDASPIKLMRNFNNWVKSVLLRTYLKKCPPQSVALDLCCGKGGDLLKWKEGKIKQLVCADISGESIAAAKERYRSEKMVGNRRREREPPFSAEFFEVDCAKDRLIDLASRPWFFDISSCQFSVHYSFESYDKAHMMLRNACENLRPSGYFIGTTIDANQIIHRLLKKGPDADGVWSIGNNIFTVTLDSSLDIHNLPLFGACYNFHLHGVVDLPEYLVHIPLLIKMLEDFEMDLVLTQNFYYFFNEHCKSNRDLLFRMSALDRNKGTMSDDEWEAVGLYLVYVFQKKATQSSSAH